MNKQLLSIAVLVACGALAWSATAAAGQTTVTPSTHSATTATTQPAATKPATKAKRAVPAPGSHDCLLSTGSHIPPPKGQCLPFAGNSYSQKDIQRTGANNLGQALQMLDPSVQIRGH